MKKVLTLMLGLIAGTASFANQATDQPSTSETRVVMTTDHKLKLYVQPVQAKGQLAIRDANGQNIYNANVSLQKGLSQAFDFSNLSMGTYQLVLKTGDQTVTKTFVVQADPYESFVVQES
ncbi:T9SS type A sorting domain-containing protein [Spirosoma sp. BT702]|uniref:T9SS type A sorting domain-containing protein n=1 Tax=Spirosoma profusum TaxID=2771354 RepID=A0A926Y370_9BACT|nr:T9SS type A sorting domain-containing protein [Spirosoma profusum]MBD2701511.1 T9SS type A sorting domain-containing protein [Spirosoma profusum]